MSQLELPDTPGALTDAVATEAPAHHGVEMLRDTIARLVPHGHPPAPPRTARTSYGFYPVYEPDDQPQQAGLGGAVAVRVALPAPVPRMGDSLTLVVDFNQVFLFDGAGDRIRVTNPG